MSKPTEVGINDQKAIVEKEQNISKSDLEENQSAKYYNKTKDGGKLAMTVKVYSPYRDYYDGQAFSISGENLTGPFDILPKHHNFISLLSPCTLTIITPNEDTNDQIQIRITGGLIHVKDNNVIVFLDI
jgi:hypothetical protein